MLGVALCLVSSVWAQAKVEPFTLSDQKDKVCTVQFPSTKKRVIIVTDKNSSSQAKLYGEELNKAVGSEVDYVLVAAVGNIPGMMRGSVKGKVNSTKQTLLDWGNKISKKLGYQEKQCLVVAVSTDGTILVKEQGDFSKDKLAELVAKLK